MKAPPVKGAPYYGIGRRLSGLRYPSREPDVPFAFSAAAAKSFGENWSTMAG